MRQRMTWATQNRGAAAAPATPGYGVEDQDHPAHTQEDPGSAPYMIGGPSDFAEDPFPPPYGDSGAPATPGYGIEDQDHPAHEGQVGRQASLRKLVEKKAAKAVRLAQATLGKNAEWDAVEDQAFNFMSMDDDALDASLNRLGGGFLAEEADPLLADDEDPILARVKAMEEELVALRRRQADQNDPAGPTLGTSGQTEEQEKKEEKAVSEKSARAKLARLFTACDMDGDDFVTEDEWLGAPEVFSELDTDGDGILARQEVLSGAIPSAFKAAADEEEEPETASKKAEDESEEETADEETASKKAARLANRALKLAKKAEDEAEEDGDEAGKEAAKKASKLAKQALVLAKKAEDEDDEEAAVEAGKKARKLAKQALKLAKKAEDGESEEPEADEPESKEASKVAFGHLADFDDDELEILQAMQYGFDEPEVAEEEPAPAVACGDVMASEEPESEPEPESEEEEGDKEASFFATGFDPMGLSDGTELTAADKAAFEEVFGKAAEDESEEPESEEPEAEKAASTRLASLLNPQPRRPSTGVQSVGRVVKQASGANEIGDLSNLWARDPDVSGSFS